MDIGAKIKKARTDVNLTQEQVAESLGVSRQTISNWENGRTYPDIISVVKLSDLYHISLDHLLKEEKGMSEYLDYLGESTNTVRSNETKGTNILICLWLSIWAGGILAFWFLNAGADAMGFSLMYFWILLPVVTFVVSLLIGRENYWGIGKWYSAFFFGLLYMLAEYATFSAANMFSFGKINLPQFGMILGGGAISALGLAAGCLMRRIRNKIHR